ncbi:hypothetical protein SVAN01_01238 [Stagonosporopsis vannaccii]|nr:hypothetical protein SVAN01_01238 [Stagonosporopsis vannaccii]
MELHQFLLVFLFALARLPGISNCENFNNSTIISTHPRPGPDDIVLRYTDLMRGPEPEDKHAGMTAHVDLHTYSGDASSATDGKVAMIRMSTVKQHVGELAGQRLFDIVHDALLKICPYERGRIGCYSSMPGAAKPYGENILESGKKYYDRYWIQDVPYKNDKGEYKTNAWITITAEAIFREDKYPGLGAATYEMAAGVFKQVTAVFRDGFLRNCYSESFSKNSRPYVFCNVPKHVLVALPVNSGDVTESWLSVMVEFNGNTRYGDFHCSTSMPNITEFWEAAVYPDVVKSMGTAADKWSQVNPCVECWSEDDRFDVKTWRNYRTCDNIGWP